MPQVLLKAARSFLLLALPVIGLIVARVWGSFLLFHVFVELFSAIVLSSVFVVTWNTRHRQANGYLTLVGLGSVFIAALGLVHTLAYNGMNVIPGVVGANAATQVWIAMGAFKALTLMAAPLLVNRKINASAVTVIYAVAFAVTVCSIFQLHIFPDCYVDGGLTAFKKSAEYLYCGLFIVAAIEWWLIRGRFSRYVRYMLLPGLVATIASELLFTKYTRVDGVWNMTGHILLMVSYYTLYKSIVQTSLTDPFDVLLGDLKLREQELRSHVAQLDSARQVAEEASNAKGRFLAILSHELRTPLTPVLASVSDMLTSEQTPEELRETLRMVQRNVVLQTRLVDDLLDMTRVDRGKMRVDCTPMDVHSAIRSAVEICRSEYDRKGLSLELRLEAPSSWINGDSGRIEQIIWNLLANARKFTPEGGKVTIRTSEGQHRNGSAIVIEVTDTGMGIERSAQQRLFIAFEQVTEAATRAGGLGLGLAITRALVDLHGGGISVHSEGAGKGSTFTVKLPTIARPVAAAEPKPAAFPAGSQPRRILLVEDHSDTARVIAQLLRRDGHDVQVASDLATARGVFAAYECDLVISDIGLPDGSGIDLLRHFRQERPRVPAICMSGYGAEQDIRASSEAGTFCHLVKPVTIQRLRQAIVDVSSQGLA